MMKAIIVAVAIGLAAVTAASAQDGPAYYYGPELEGFDYPYPVDRFRFTSQRQDLQMTFMEVAPAGTPNGRTVVLLHGKNFCGATW